MRRHQFAHGQLNNCEYEKIAVIVILSGCGLAIALALAVLICCQLLIKPKYARYGCPNSVLVFERQTTTSDENNIDYNSGCYEDSFFQKELCDSLCDTNGDAVGSPNTVVAQTHYTPSNGAQTQTTSPPQPRSSSPQVKFVSQPLKNNNRKASLPCKLTNVQPKCEPQPKDINDNKRRASAGIIRQKSFDDIEVDISYNQSDLSERRQRTAAENKTISTDVLRKQYRELWQLRTTYEAEETETSNDSGDSLPPNQQRLVKNDSGYKSIERRDYSIDYKTEYIFRQFTASTPQRHSITHQQSIKEEQENEVQAAFV